MEFVLSQESAVRILVGFISGFIVGLERQKEIERSGAKQAGLRTFTLLGLTGSLAFLSGNSTLQVAITAAVGIFVAVYAYYRMFGLVEVGVTTPVAMLATYTIGALAGLGLITEAIAGSLIVTLLLTSKYELRSLAQRISKEELISVVQLAILLTLVYPLIPNITDPITNAVNLRTAYFIARLLLTISFLNYVMLKLLGPKGVVTFGLLGGFVSSEATTYTAYLELKGGRIAMATASVSLIALYLKLIMIVAVLSRDLLPLIYKGALSAIAFLSMAGIILAGKASVSLEKLPSPISYSSALKFTFTFIAISFLVAVIEKYASRYYLLAVFLSSFVSVTAVTFSVLSLYTHGIIATSEAAIYLSIAMATGALNKILYTTLAGASKKEIIKLSAIIVITALLALRPILE